MEVNIKLSRPHPGQMKVLNSKAKYRVLCCGRRAGKSYLASIIALQELLNKGIVAYCCPTFALSKYFFQELVKMIPPELITVVNKSDLYLETITGGNITFFTCNGDNPVRGRYFTLALLDEASYINNLEDFWLNDLGPCLGDLNGKAVFLSTPNGQNYFYSLFMKGQNHEDDFESFRFTTLQNPHFPAEEWYAAKARMPAARFQQEYEAIPNSSNNNPFGMTQIQAATLTELSNDPAIVFGIDLAKYHDWTVVCGLDANGHLCYFDRFQLPWTLTQQKIEALPASVLKVVDSTGVGDVVFEHLQSSCQNIIGFKFTTQSKPMIVYELIKDVEQGGVKFNDIIANEMMVFEVKQNKDTGHLKFEAQSGYHDDCIMSLALANHHRTQAVTAANWKTYST